jgi:nondiscriminating glutamyl-tRNA synthetase
LQPQPSEELKEVRKILASLENWKEENVRQVIHDKKLFPLIRIQLTGQKSGPELPKIICLLGKEKVLNRLNC